MTWYCFIIQNKETASSQQYNNITASKTWLEENIAAFTGDVGVFKMSKQYFMIVVFVL